MKKTIFSICILLSAFAKAQTIDNIYVNLYTDSLKKGTYNYINIDGLLSNGRYLPLDSTHLIFSASAGKFYGNNLWLDKSFAGNKVDFKVVLKANPALYKEFSVFIKTKADNEQLKTVDEILNDVRNKPKSNKKKN
ncbi:hypothetical protein LK994_11895 [Ferruginibacter lapsinanis]|uniref:hypothetical protein n=1 Tax=Ferruginibacter lapsinanis TaxID=563172 RepID=UPI001E3A6C44|nr:hypothetical protein [Ferruginibacter lapsinanis]UEG49334.1 hypothetical protein LK994_11895 [Ferruginibacter lapsinanis]